MDNETQIVQKAGWIIFDGQNFYAVKRDYYWDISLPKWHIDPGENPQQAALREVLEETWLKCKILWDLWISEYSNNEWLVHVYYYAMEIEEKVTNELFPDVTWIFYANSDEILNNLTYESDKEIFKKWVEFFMKKWN